MPASKTWKALVDALPDAVIGLSGGRVTFLNELAGQLFGVEIDPPPSAERLFPRDQDRQLLESATPGTPLELEGRRGEGRAFVADVRCKAIEEGRENVTLCVVREIPMRAADQERYRKAAELFELGRFDHDQITDELWGSLSHRKLYGVPPEETLTIPRLLQGLHPEDFDLVAPAIARAHDPSGDGRFDVEHRVIWPSGEIRWIRTMSQTYFGEIDGKRRPIRTVGASADQTARRDAERETERIVAVLEASPDFVAIAAPDGSLLYLNHSARALLGVTEDEDISRRKLGDHYTDMSRSELLSRALPGAKRDGVWTGEATLRAVSGKEVPVSLVALAHFRADDSLERYATIARDLTREKQLEAQLHHSQKMEALGRVAGGAAHDFNNLLSVIIGGTDFALSRLPAEDPVRNELTSVLEASRRATDLTQQMLTFSRKSASPAGMVIDINEIITGMMPIVSRIVGKKIKLVLELANRPSTIKADPSQIEQVILNLVVNARDAMPHGGTLTLETAVVSVDEKQPYLDRHPGQYVVLSISDDGSGMDPVTKAHIFEPFFTTKELGEGTGLGLSTVFGIVKQTRGSIQVQSELGRGTQFAISIPHIEYPEGSQKITKGSTERDSSASSRSRRARADEPSRIDVNGYRIFRA